MCVCVCFFFLFFLPQFVIKSSQMVFVRIGIGAGLECAKCKIALGLLVSLLMTHSKRLFYKGLFEL